MPTYDYCCEKCGHEEEHWQKISESALTVCPVCHSDQYRRKVSAPSFQLKGSGWYATDFRSNSSQGSSAVEESTSATSSESSEKGSQEVMSEDTKTCCGTCPGCPSHSGASKES